MQLAEKTKKKFCVSLNSSGKKRVSGKRLAFPDTKQVPF
tara:strand:- start:723 stop:839 length:117 start_codon:yes stop_codon:yes gene_type:complete